jgi:hypothetical protein
MIPNKNYSVSLPVGQQFRFGLGAEWQTSPKLNVAFSYELTYGGDLSVNQNRGPLAGAVVGQFHELREPLLGEFHLGERRKPDSERNKLRGRLIFDQPPAQGFQALSQFLECGGKPIMAP